MSSQMKDRYCCLRVTLLIPVVTTGSEGHVSILEGTCGKTRTTGTSCIITQDGMLVTQGNSPKQTVKRIESNGPWDNSPYDF